MLQPSSILHLETSDFLQNELQFKRVSCHYYPVINTSAAGEAFSSMAAVENVTQPTDNMSNFSLPIAIMSNSTVYPIYFNKMLYERIVEDCWKEFNDSMFHINQEYWCNWDHIVSAYNVLQLCLEYHAEDLDIAFPNELAHDAILKAHMYHFKNCSLLSEELLDPPENILFGLIFAPICIIPFLVTLVVYKSNTSKAQT